VKRKNREKEGGFRGRRMDSRAKTAGKVIVLIVIGVITVTGCAGPRWTGPGDIKRKELTPEHDTIRITSTPSGAKVMVGERVVGITPLSFDVSFKRVKHYREDRFMDGDKILERKIIDCGMEYSPDCYTITVSKRGYRPCSLQHRGDNRDGRYHANIVLEKE
jgi:hypothetical protein